MLNLISKDGKSYVQLTELYSKLQLNPTVYARYVKEQLIENDYAQAETDYYTLAYKTQPQGGRPKNDYLLTLDFAKDLIIRSKSKVGKTYRDWLIDLSNQREKGDLLTHEESIWFHRAIECLKYVSNQKKAQELHMAEHSTGSNAKNKHASFYVLRTQITGWDKDKVNEAVVQWCKDNQKSLPSATNMRDKLNVIEPAEAMRLAVIDILYANGESGDKVEKASYVLKALVEKMKLKTVRENLTDLFQIRQEDAASPLELKQLTKLN